MAFLALNDRQIVLGGSTISLGGPTIVEWIMQEVQTEAWGLQGNGAGIWTGQNVQAETWGGTSNSAGVWSKQTPPTVDWN